MDGLVSPHAKQSGAQDALRALFYVDLEEAVGLALLHRARDSRHRPLPDQRLEPVFSYVRLAHAHTAERWIGVKRIDRDALRVLAPPGVAKHIIGDDLVVVVGGVRKGALAVAIAERPNIRIR